MGTDEKKKVVVKKAIVKKIMKKSIAMLVREKLALKNVPKFEEMVKLVKALNPSSKFNKAQYNWYKSKANKAAKLTVKA